MKMSEGLQKCVQCDKTSDAEGLKRCAGCRKVAYCDTQCQAAGWPSHQVFCISVSRIDLLKKRWTRFPPARRAQREYALANGEQVMSPYESGVLTESLQEDVVKIRRSLRQWLALSEAWQEGADDEIIQATVDLASLQLHPDHTFQPQPKPLFRRTFLSYAKTYWLALLASLNADQLNELSRRLDLTPPHGETVPRLEGQKCVYRPGDLKAKEVEGLMRTVVYVTMEMVPPEVTRSLVELAEAGVQLWEENYELKKKM